MGPIFKTELLIYQSKANFGEKNLFAKITRHLDLESRKMPVVSFRNRISISMANILYIRMERGILVPKHSSHKHFPPGGGTWFANIRGGAAGKSEKLPCPGVRFLKMIPCPGAKGS